MHHPTLAGPRRRTRRALLAAALPAALAAVALPSAAQAASVSDVPIGSGKRAVLVFDRSFTGGSTEANDVTVRAEPISSGSLIVVTDRAGVTADGGSCFRFSATEARCPVPSDAEVDVNLAGGDDRMQYQARHRGTVGLGSGSDALLAGTRELNGAGGLLEPVSYGGGTGTDTINYINADRGVRLTPEDGLANDGRLIDRENVGADFETIIGSNFADAPLFGTPNADTMFGAAATTRSPAARATTCSFPASRTAPTTTAAATASTTGSSTTDAPSRSPSTSTASPTTDRPARTTTCTAMSRRWSAVPPPTC
jgi:hypothetical protein